MKKIEHVGIAVKELAVSIPVFEKILNTRCYKTEYVDSEQVNTAFFSLGENKIEQTKILFRHDSSWGAQPTHPHPHFSPDGKYVMFSTDKTGNPQVYTVEINLK